MAVSISGATQKNIDTTIDVVVNLVKKMLKEPDGPPDNYGVRLAIRAALRVERIKTMHRTLIFMQEEGVDPAVVEEFEGQIAAEEKAAEKEG
jgi:hypothetical protein